MTRNHRQDPVETWHHITNHAVGKEDLFLTDTDRYQFIRRMNEAAMKYDVSVVAFCLMGNHFHLVVWCQSAGVSAFMHYLESTYAREFNMRHARRGALFAHRFFNKIIRTDGQALATVRYVHRNPLELGIDITTYPWSSYLAHIDRDHELLAADTHTFRQLLGNALEHRSYVETDFPHDEQKISNGTRSIYRASPPSLEISVIRLCDLAAAMYAVSAEEILAPRDRTRNDARLAVSLICAEHRTGFSGELSRLLGYAATNAFHAAVRRARLRFSKDPLFRRSVFDLRAAWDIDPLAQAA